MFEDDDGVTTEANTSKSGNTPVARLIGNATKRLITKNDLLPENGLNNFKRRLLPDNGFNDLKRRKLVLQNRKLELETKKLELENKKLEMEIKQLEKRQDEGESSVGGDTYYVSHVIDDSKDGLTDGATTFSSSAAEVIKSLTGRGQPIQIIAQ